MNSRRISIALGIAAMASITAQPARSEPAVDCDAIFDRQGHGETFYEDNPSYRDPAGPLDWPAAAPSDEGIDATLLNEGIDELLAAPNALGVVVVRHGKLVAERYANGGAADRANNMHSASKSILSALVGIAIRDGYIEGVDQEVAAFLPGYFADAGADKSGMTIGDLLTMSSGLAWQEDLTEYVIQNEPDWVGAILGRDMTGAPGETFHYSTGVTHVLSAVLTAATGSSTCEFAHRHLFGPLGMTAEHWGRDAQGISSGGYNLYLTPREMAAFGQLYLQGGNWRDVQIVPAEWVSESWTAHRIVDDTYDYGYLWWLREIMGRFVAQAWGWGGQMIYVVPDLGIVVVTTSNTADDVPVLEGSDFVRHADRFVRDAVIGAIP